MTIKSDNTLFTFMCDNIGQVKEDVAQFEIDRLKKQDDGNWRIDRSSYMFTMDETDDEVYNPCELKHGYVWITCTQKQ